MEDVNNLTKEEFLKFLNCSHHSVSTKREKIVVTGPKNQKLTVLKQFGKYTASRVQLEECALNRQVLRIPLPIYDIKKLPAKQVALKFRTRKNKQKKRNVGLSRFGRKLKKKTGLATRASPRRPIRTLQKTTNTKSEVFTKDKIAKPSAKPQVFTKDKNAKPEISTKDRKTKSEISTKDKNTKPEVSTKDKNRDKNTKPSIKPVVSTKAKHTRPEVYTKYKTTRPEIPTNNNYTVFQKCKLPKIIGPPQTAKKPRPKQTLQQQMSSIYQSFGQQQASPMKPQFIIKYVPAEPTYFLKMPTIKHPEDGKLQYPFEKLVKDIKNLKLPSTTWKIKVVVKNNKIASIIFTNKCVLERTVSFDAVSAYYEIVIENKPAILLGSPNEVTCVEDIEILLNIIHTIDAKDCMIFYKK